MYYGCNNCSTCTIGTAMRWCGKPLIQKALPPQPIFGVTVQRGVAPKEFNTLREAAKFAKEASRSNGGYWCVVYVLPKQGMLWHEIARRDIPGTVRIGGYFDGRHNVKSTK